MPARLSTTYSGALDGIHAKLVEIEVDLHVGLHSFTIVGLADKAVNEARERVSAALKSAGAKSPSRENRKITVNLAPADLKKTGAHYDLPIAIGYLLATGQMPPFDSRSVLFAGELALDGRLRAIRGGLNIADMAAARGFARIIVPRENGAEASAIGTIEVIAADTLGEVIAILAGEQSPRALDASEWESAGSAADICGAPNFAMIKGQSHVKRALTIAASGPHNILMIGPPGVGKSTLAAALPGILPPLERQEAIELTKIWSAAGKHPQGLLRERPFRAPHHSASVAALVGGGAYPRPGEISLAHHGVLFLDELPEFPAGALESLRAPLETGVVHVARVKDTLMFPARFSLVAAMNPCPCGFAGDGQEECRCTPAMRMKYSKKISGPLLDRIDLQVTLPRVPVELLREASSKRETSAEAKQAVLAARAFKAARVQEEKKKKGGEEHEAAGTMIFTNDGARFLDTLRGVNLSPRSYYRLLNVARTIADIEAEECVSAAHLAEAMSYRLREQS